MTVLPSAVGLRLPPDLKPGEHKLKGIDTTLMVREFTPEMADSLVQKPKAAETWLERPEAGKRGEELKPRFVNPSGAEAEEGAKAGEVVELGGSKHTPSGGAEAWEAALGNAFHAYFAALPSLASADKALKLCVAGRCLKGHEAESLAPVEFLVESGDRLAAWAAKKYPGAKWLTEAVVTAPCGSGGQWSGVADLILLIGKDRAIVVDHKAVQVSSGRCAERAAGYSGQIAAYREILKAQGLTVQESWIHFPLAAAMVSMG